MSIKSFVCFKETNSVFALYATDTENMSWGGYPVGAAISRPHLRSITNPLRRWIAALTKEINGERKKTELQQRAAVPLDI